MITWIKIMVTISTAAIEITKLIIREGFLFFATLFFLPVKFITHTPNCTDHDWLAGIDFDLLLNHSRVALAASAVGLANAASDYARDYAKERIQFEEPIAHRQSIAFMLAEMAIEVDSARLMVWETAWRLDRGEDATQEATVMKHFVDQAVMHVADSAVQILGGYGYIREYPAELWLRNARGFSSFDGLSIV